MFSISLESCEVKENASMCQAIVDEINAFFAGLSSEGSVSLEEAERRVLEVSRSFGQKCLTLVASEQSSAGSCEEVKCPVPDCDNVCRRWVERPRYVSTLCGLILVPRWVYRCSSGHTHAPWDGASRLRGQYTHAVAEAMCRLCSRLDFREAESELLRQGIEVSHTTLHQMVGKWSEGLCVSAEVEVQTLGLDERWYIECDGCHTNSPIGYKEVKVGTVYRDYPQPAGSRGIPSARPDSIRYVASRDKAEDFGKSLYALATNSGMYKEDIETQEIVFIADGAAWIWNLADEHFLNAVQIVDYMHAKSHLYTAAKVAYGEAETEAIEQWVRTIEPLLSDGNIAELIAHIHALDTQTPEAAETLQREARYFEKHQKRMQYKTFRDKGNHKIGSGVIESACKHVVAQRCKQAGMRWEKEGIEAVLAFRCLDKNNAWDNYWYPETKVSA